MTSYEQYGGGGFMASQSNESPASKSGRGQDKGLLPLTIKQLLDANVDGGDDSTIKVDGRELGQLTFVGQILSIQEMSTMITYDINDGTGNIEVKLWPENGEENEFTIRNKQSLVEGAYVRVTGNCRVFNEKKNVTAFRISPITDFNELTYHLLDACHAHLYNTRGPLGSNTSTINAAPSPAAKPGQASMFQGFGGAMGGMAANSTAPIKQRILNAYDQPRFAGDNANGVSQQDLAAFLGIPVHEIRPHMEQLSMEGHLYSTIDEDHFARVQ